MTFTQALNFWPTFLLVFFRLAGLMVFAPLLGSARIPRRVKLLLALVTSMGLAGGVRTPVVLPDNLGQLILAIGGELVFGIAMGMLVSFTFIAVQWAGEMIGQQMGFNLSEVFDPQFSSGGSLVGELYFMLTLIVFLFIGGHRTMLRAFEASLNTLPLMSVGFDHSLFDLLISGLTTAMTLAVRLAAPMFFTMLVVDLSMGCISRAMPQFNVMTAGLTIRAIVGMVVLIIGVGLSAEVIEQSLRDSLDDFSRNYAPNVALAENNAVRAARLSPVGAAPPFIRRAA